MRLISATLILALASARPQRLRRTLKEKADKSGPLAEEIEVAIETRQFGDNITPMSMAPAPLTPAPVMPATPAPVTPAPVTPAPVTPAPVTAAPSTATPAPIWGNPCNMDPVVRREMILNKLSTVTAMEELEDKKNSANESAEWLIEEDALYLCPDDPKLIQRYVMGKLYFQTKGDNWLQCARPSTGKVKPPTCVAPEPTAGGGGGELQGTPWLEPVNECEWAFVTCSPDKCIIRIEVDENAVTGTLVNEIDALEFLEVYTMDGLPNALEGTIPTQFGNLPNLRILDLDENNLTGTIPDSIYTGAPNLEQLDLDSNNLTGTINSLIGDLKSLRFVQLFNNPISGEIPVSIANLDNLDTLGLYGMDLIGSVDPSICDLRTTNGGKLEFLWTDCGVPNNGGAPQVECSCCDFCAVG